MHTLVIYDITNDKIRLAIAQACKEAGLIRIQKSAFIGEINAQTRKHLKKKLTKILGKNKGNIQIFQICDADLKLREIIGEPYTEEEEEIIII
ncbi:MAG: CRISPR-associated endonuclease Cas2 [Candidatus Methanomethylicia archaeon]